MTLLMGCAGPSPQPRLSLGEGQTPEALAAVRHVLRDRGYRIAKDQPRFGTITTEPLPSPIALEFWQDENLTAGALGESTITNLRRKIRIQLDPVTPASNSADPEPVGQYELGVVVLLERRQNPMARMNGSSRSVFSSLRDVPAELKSRGINGSYWQPYRRDTALEDRLLREITKQLQAPLSGADLGAAG